MAAQRVGIADVHVVLARIHNVRTQPLTGGVGRQRVPFGGLRRKRIDAEAVRGQFAAANRRIRQDGQGVQGANVLRRDVREHKIGELIDVEPVAAAQHPPPIPRQVVGESDSRREILGRRPWHPAVRIPNRLQHQPRRIVRVMLLIQRVQIEVVAHPQVQRQARRHSPVVLEPRPELMHVLEGVGIRPDAVDGPAVGLLPPRHDPWCLKALRIAPVAVAEDHRRIIEERQRRKMFVRVQGPQPEHGSCSSRRTSGRGSRRAATHRRGYGSRPDVDIRSTCSASPGVDRRERQARREDVHIGEVSVVVLSRDDTVNVVVVVSMVHLAGDLVQAAVAQDPAVLGDGAPKTSGGDPPAHADHCSR